MKFIFVDQLKTKSYTTSTPYTIGVGGIQSAICYYCEELVKQGHEVIVINEQPSETVDRGVHFKPRTWFFEQTEYIVDVIVLCSAVNDKYISTMHSKFKYALSILWSGHHFNESPLKGFQTILYDFDLFAFVSDHQRNAHCNLFNLPHEKTILMNNGFSPSFTQSVDPSKKTKSLIYFSAPERGLKHFVDIWPKVLEKHPDAHLEIYSSRANYGVPDIEETVSIKKKLSAYPNTSVNSSIGQSELAKACAKAAIFAYPCDFVETSCICLLEARAAGCKPICSDIGVLPTLLHNCVKYDEHFVDSFVDSLCKQLDRFDTNRDEFNAEAYAESNSIQISFNYSNLVAQFLKNVDQLTNVKANAIARQIFLKSVEGSLVLTIEDSTSLFFKNKLDAATFYLKRGIHYYNTMWHHMAELMFLKSWSIIPSDAAAQNLFHFYDTAKNTAKMMEWYYKYSLLKGSNEKMAALLKTAINGNSRILGPFLEQLVSSNPTTSGWDFFKNVYVISLENAIKRRSHISSHFGSNKINFSFFNAVDGRKTHDALKLFAANRKIVTDSCAKELTPGALGCLMSHYKLWEKIYIESDSTNSWTLICEDDLEFHPSFTPESLNSYLRTIPLDAKMLKFGWFKFDSIHKERIVPYNDKWVKFLGRGVPSTICYAIHTSILPVLLAKTYEHAIDDFEIDGSYGCTDLCLDPSFFYCDTYKTTFKGVCADCKDPSQINS